jgi:hypothetical protein
MSNEILKHERGETIVFGIRIKPNEVTTYDGTEIVTCWIKKAINGSIVPDDAEPAIHEITPIFSSTDNAWIFTVSAEDCAEKFKAGSYITDAKIEYSSGFVSKPSPLVLKIAGRVTR